MVFNQFRKNIISNAQQNGQLKPFHCRVDNDFLLRRKTIFLKLPNASHELTVGQLSANIFFGNLRNNANINVI